MTTQEQESPGQGIAEQREEFRMVAGECDPEVMNRYLATLAPEKLSEAMDKMVNRAVTVDFAPNEKESMLHELLARDFVTRSVEPIKGMVLKIRSIDEQDNDWIWARPVGEVVDDSPRSRRTRQVRLITASVQEVGGQPLPDDRVKRETYWRAKSPHVIDAVSEAVGRFDRKVRAALQDESAVGK